MANSVISGIITKDESPSFSNAKIFKNNESQNGGITKIKTDEIMDLNTNNTSNIISDENKGKALELLKQVGATISVGVTSITEGIGKFGENIIDTGASIAPIMESPYLIAIDAYNAGLKSQVVGWKAILHGDNVIESIKTSFDDHTWLTKKYFEKSKSFVSKNYTADWYSKIWNETSLGTKLKNSSFGFDITRGIGSGIGYVAGVVATAALTGGASLGASAGTSAGTTTISSINLGATAGLAGFGQGVENAWSKGAGYIKGYVSGAANGIWEGVQFALGAEIEGKVTSGIVRILANSALGASEGVARPYLNMIANPNKTTYAKEWDENGGIVSVLTGAAIAGGASAIGELFNISKLFGNKGKTSSLYDKIEVNKLNLVDDIKPTSIESKLGGSRGFSIENLNNSYKGYDIVYNVKNNNIASVLDDLLNTPSNKNLVVIDNTLSLTDDLIKKLPDNTDIRILGGYTDDYLKGFKFGASGEITLNHVTFSKEEIISIMNKLDDFDKGINPNWTDIQKAEYAYEYLSENLDYNANPGGSMIRSKEYDGLLSLVKGKSTCQGFAETYKQLLDRMGITSTTIGGSLNNTGQHAYTIVSINNKSFVVDPVRPFIRNGESGFNVNPSEYFAKNNTSLLDKVKNTYVVSKLTNDRVQITSFEDVGNIKTNDLRRQIEGILSEYPEASIRLKSLLHKIDDKEYASDEIIKEASETISTIFSHQMKFDTYTDTSGLIFDFTDSFILKDNIDLLYKIKQAEDYAHFYKNPDGTYTYIANDLDYFDPEHIEKILRYACANDLSLATSPEAIIQNIDANIKEIQNEIKSSTLHDYLGNKAFIKENTEYINKAYKTLVDSKYITSEEKSLVAGYKNEIDTLTSEINKISRGKHLSREDYLQLSDTYKKLLSVEEELSNINDNAWQRYFSSSNTVFAHSYTGNVVSASEFPGKICTSLLTDNDGTLIGNVGVEFRPSLKDVDTLSPIDAGSWDVETMGKFIENNADSWQWRNGNGIFYEGGEHSKLFSPEYMEKSLLDAKEVSTYTEIVIKNHNVKPFRYYLSSAATDDEIKQIFKLAKKDNVPVELINMKTYAREIINSIKDIGR